MVIFAAARVYVYRDFLEYNFILCSCSSWWMGSGFESHQGDGWCQERHPTTNAPVLQRHISPKTRWERNLIQSFSQGMKILSRLEFYVENKIVQSENPNVVNITQGTSSWNSIQYCLSLTAFLFIQPFHFNLVRSLFLNHYWYYMITRFFECIHIR